MRGGYSSATTYGMAVNGSQESQFSRTFDQSGPYGNVPGNSLIGTSGQGLSTSSRMPTQAELNLAQSGGRRRIRGGFLGEVVNQAIVPFGLLGLQQTYGRKKGGKRTRKNRSHRRH